MPDIDKTLSSDPCSQWVLQASGRISSLVKRTPVLSSASIDSAAGCEILFKCENLQTTGSFKYRGASHALALLSEELPEGIECVATHSSGNHGAALARAAHARSIDAVIVMPEGSVASKVSAVRAYGGEVILCGALMADREHALSDVVLSRGAHVVPPYDDARIIAGQGTAALEFLEQAPLLDSMLVPVGGGGLAAGTALALEGTGVALLLAEPKLADDAARSLHDGTRYPPLPPATIADGLRAGLGELNFEILNRRSGASGYVSVGCVSEAAIRSAMRLMWQRLKLVVEPSGAVPLALLMEHGADTLELAGKTVGVIVSGGNVDFPSTDEPIDH